MDWNELSIMFRKFLPDFSVEVRPPCISEYRELQYLYTAKAVALGLQENDKVVVDKENKKIALGYRKEEDNPWANIKVQVGDIVENKLPKETKTIVYGE